MCGKKKEPGYEATVGVRSGTHENSVLAQLMSSTLERVEIVECSM